MRRPIFLLVVIFIISAAAALFVYPALLGDKILPWRLGLDLVGGAHLIYEIDMSGVAAEDRSSVMGGTRDIMERRVNVFGVSEPHVVTAKSGEAYRVVVELAGVKDVSEAINQIGRTALLEFREVRDRGEGQPPEFLLPKLTGRYLVRAQAGFNQQALQTEISIAFNSEGAKIFESLTEQNIGKQIAIFLDGQVISAPVVQAKISGGNAVISGQFTPEAARDLAALLNAGALPAPLKLISQQTVGASLGLNSLQKTLMAGAIGTLVVIAFMILYYRSLGFFAALALLVYIVFTLAVFKGISMTMTLAGIAGFILTIGMAVDANILIFERSKEELRKGISRAAAIQEGFRRAWPSIRDSNISTIITAVILYYMTTSFVKGFALALLIGVLVSMFSAITVTRTMLRVFVKQ